MPGGTTGEQVASVRGTGSETGADAEELLPVRRGYYDECKCDKCLDQSAAKARGP